MFIIIASLKPDERHLVLVKVPIQEICVGEKSNPLQNPFRSIIDLRVEEEQSLKLSTQPSLGYWGRNSPSPSLLNGERATILTFVMRPHRIHRRTCMYTCQPLEMKYSLFCFLSLGIWKRVASVLSLTARSPGTGWSGCSNFIARFDRERYSRIEVSKTSALEGFEPRELGIDGRSREPLYIECRGSYVGGNSNVTNWMSSSFGCIWIQKAVFRVRLYTAWLQKIRPLSVSLLGGFCDSSLSRQGRFREGKGAGQVTRNRWWLAVCGNR